MTIRIPHCQGKTYAVLGLGRTGRAASVALKESGARVWAWDDNPAARAELGHEMPAINLRDCNWRQVEALILSPGIPHTYPEPHPVVAAARQADIPILSDIELLFRACPEARYIGVTGTNGKSTVTALIAHLLASNGVTVQIGGNLGQAALSLLPLGRDGTYVLELSSYQLELTPSALCDIAVLLNLSSDHLARHGGWEGYIAAKKSILRPKGQGSMGIVGIDDAPTRTLLTELAGAGRALIGISGHGHVQGGVWVEDSVLRDDRTGFAADIGKIATLPGTHNAQNAAASYAAASAAGLASEAIIAAMRTYPGLAHRQEIVGRIGGVAYVNDSKATNADAAGKALACYSDIYWLVGGRAKEGGLAGLASFYPRIRRAYLFGEAEEAFAATLEGEVEFQRCGDLAKAFACAHRDAQRAGQGVVLLSPACASWDRYANFEARGDHFRALVADCQRKGAA
ncbi:MAG TPA: UDP-N-acetylmuramoyl-L-alanine--D-glutamate ligase [Dongiaceae bacterium]|nr:UDP-N-acetylmuramoyl-L-alanine--D-glutamate ligase [Dongiaceae bacterium]